LKKSQIALICATFVALFYAFNFTAAKEVTPSPIGAFALTWYRVAITGAIFWILATIFRPSDRVPTRELPRIALAAFCGVGFNMVTFMWGLSKTTPIAASVLMVTTPMIVLVLSAIFLKEQLKLIRIVGIIIGFTGTAGLILLTKGRGADASDPLIGNFLIFINAVSYSFYIVLASKLTQRYHVLTLMKWLYFFGILFITPVAFHQLGDWDPRGADMHTLLNAGYVVLFATFGTYMLNIIAIKNLKPSVVAVFVYLQPLLATLIAVGLDKDRITLTKVIAALLIFTGVFLTTKKSKPKVAL